MERLLLNQQPGQLLVLDLSQPIDIDAFQYLIDSLHHVIPIVCTLPGPSRVPLFSIAIANPQFDQRYEILLGFERTRSNFTNIYKAICKLQEKKETLSSCSNRSSSNLIECLLSLLTSHQSLAQKPGYNADLEVTIISGQLNYRLKPMIYEAFKQSTSDHVKFLTVIFVKSAARLRFEDLDNFEDDTANNEDLFSLVLPNVNYISSTNCSDLSKIKDHFMSWLIDRNKDSHHLELALPHPYNEREQKTLKFDTRECLLPTTVLPGYKNIALETSAAFIKPPTLLNKSESAIKWALPIHRLQAIEIVPASSNIIQCLYGNPVVLEATQCWKVDWDELDENIKSVEALQHQLSKEDKLLICQSILNNEEIIPRLYYCISSASHCLVVHNIASSEMVLLSEYAGKVEKPSPDVSYQSTIDMEMCLSQLDGRDRFRLSTVETKTPPTNYLKSLVRNMLPKRFTTKRPARQPGLHTMVDTDNCPDSNRSSREHPSAVKKQKPSQSEQRPSQRRASLPLTHSKPLQFKFRAVRPLPTSVLPGKVDSTPQTDVTEDICISSSEDEQSSTGAYTPVQLH